MEKPQLRKVNLLFMQSWDPGSRLSPSYPSSPENRESCLKSPPGATSLTASRVAKPLLHAPDSPLCARGTWEDTCFALADSAEPFFLFFSFIFLILLLLLFFTLQYCIGFAIHQHTSTMGVHGFSLSWDMSRCSHCPRSLSTFEVTNLFILAILMGL